MKRTTQTGYKEIVRNSRPSSYTIVIQDGYDSYRVKTYTRAYINRSNKSNTPGRTYGIVAINKIKAENEGKFIFAFEKDMNGGIHKANINEVEWW